MLDLRLIKFLRGVFFQFLAAAGSSCPKGPYFDSFSLYSNYPFSFCLMIAKSILHFLNLRLQLTNLNDFLLPLNVIHFWSLICNTLFLSLHLNIGSCCCSCTSEQNCSYYFSVSVLRKTVPI